MRRRGAAKASRISNFCNSGGACGYKCAHRTLDFLLRSGPVADADPNNAVAAPG